MNIIEKSRPLASKAKEQIFLNKLIRPNADGSKLLEH